MLRYAHRLGRPPQVNRHLPAEGIETALGISATSQGTAGNRTGRPRRLHPERHLQALSLLFISTSGTMTTKTSELLSLVLGRRDRLDPDERKALSQLSVRTLRFSHGETIIPAGPTASESCLVVSGMALRVQSTCSGRDVVSAVHIPGDFVDLHALVLERLDHSVIAQGDCKVQFVDLQQLRKITSDFPHLTRLLWMLTLIDAKIHRAWLAAAATLRTNERIANFLCELYTRYEMIGFVKNGCFEMPLQQKDMERLFGFSRSHVNRAVQELRARGLIDWTRDQVTVHDLENLQSYGKFDPDYLEVVSASR